MLRGSCLSFIQSTPLPGAQYPFVGDGLAPHLGVAPTSPDGISAPSRRHQGTPPPGSPIKVPCGWFV
jgi:hypothetical protein